MGPKTHLPADTQDLHDGSAVRLVGVEGTLNEVGSSFNLFPAITGDEDYAMDGFLEFVPPGWFVVIWVVVSRLLMARVAEEFCVGKLPERERSWTVYGVPSVV
jgi:hypothetical protein